MEQLLELIEQVMQRNHHLEETVKQLRDEIAVLKGQKGKPKFKASGMDREADSEASTKEEELSGERAKKRAGSAKRSKTRERTIHEEVPIPPMQPLPCGSRFKGYRDFVVQDLKMATHNTRYRVEVWQTPDGECLCGELPSNLHGGHFGPGLRTDLLYQHHHCHVTQPLLREQLVEWGVDISVGQIDALLSGHHEDFSHEKDQLLAVGLQVSRSITVDDSSARHRGKNGYVTQIGNDLFAWFSSTFRKSRVNFLQLLHAGCLTYCLNERARDYLHKQGLPKDLFRRLEAHPMVEIANADAWESHLHTLGIDSQRHRRIATEGALLGGLLAKGFSLDLAIVSDGAGQFAILLHALCWVHAERLVHQLIPLNDRQRLDQEQVRGEIWGLYADLKAYQRNPDPALVPV